MLVHTIALELIQGMVMQVACWQRRGEGERKKQRGTETSLILTSSQTEQVDTENK